MMCRTVGPFFFFFYPVHSILFLRFASIFGGQFIMTRLALVQGVSRAEINKKSARFSTERRQRRAAEESQTNTGGVQY